MKILIVDDDIAQRTMLQTFVNNLGHEVLTASDGYEGLETWKSEKPGIVITDWMMPNIDGLELCRRIRGAGFERYTYIIIVSIQDTHQDIVRGLEGGVDDYLTKPVRFREFKARVEIGERIVRLESKLGRKYDAIRRNYFQTIRMFTNLMEVYNEKLGGHSRRTAETALRIAKRHSELSEQDYQNVETAGLLHDIGMVGMPNYLIEKRLLEMTGDEKSVYGAHPVQGEMILGEIEVLGPIASVVRSHHEKWDGRGFPDGLKGDRIPLLARIIYAASEYDDYLHKWKLSFDQITDRLLQNRGYGFDPEVVDHLIKINQECRLEEEGRDFREIPLEELAEGMVLATDVRMRGGVLVVPSHTKMTGYGIRKLRNLNEMSCISNKVCVFKNRT